MARKKQKNYLVAAEHIGAGCPKIPEELDTPSWKGYDILTHTPPEKRWNDELHKRGIKAMPYLTLNYQYIGSDIAGWDAETTPDCIIIDQLGRNQLHQNYLRNDGKLIYEICPNTKKARDIYLKKAEERIKSGADGLFLDNASPARKCWGPDFGRHKHIHAGEKIPQADFHTGFCYPKSAKSNMLEIPIGDSEQTYATAMLIKEIRGLVKSFGEEKALMINGGDGSCTPELFFEQVDSVMNEMFIYATYRDYNIAVPTHLDFQEHNIFDWMSVLEWQEQFAKKGVRMNCLSAYSVHDPNRKQHSIFAFCTAKLWDALYYTGNDVELDAWMREIRLGEPLLPTPGSWGAVLFREYDNGLVVVNPYGVAQQACVPWKKKPEKLIIHGEGVKIVNGVSNDSITVKIAPDCAGIIIPEK